jgi:hypothetical protein
MPPKGKQPPKPAVTKARSKKNKQPTQVNPNGIRHKVLCADGKIRWKWGHEL